MQTRGGGFGSLPLSLDTNASEGRSGFIHISFAMNAQRSSEWGKKGTGILLVMMIRRASAIVVFALFPGLNPARRAESIPSPALSSRPLDVIGIASWYGPGFEGKPTASTRIFNSQELTCAHRTIPFFKIVEIENLSNGARVRVKVTDRGPFIPGRDFDLSRAVAIELGFEERGLATIRYRIVEEGRS